MKKRIFMLLLTMTVLLGALTLTVSASEIKVLANGTCGENLTWKLDSEGTLTISGTGDMTDYDSHTYSDTPWYSWRASILSIVVKDDVTSIDAGAFSGCSALESITIPFVGRSVKTETDTSQYPFGYIFGCRSYTGGTGATQLFYGSSTSDTTSHTYYIPSSLKTVTVTGGTILRGAFYNCENLTSITLPNSGTSIGEDAFLNCTSLSSIKIPGGITSIGDSAFHNCTSLSSIKIPGSVTSIGDSAFYSCTGLSSIKIPGGVTSIGKWAFSGCTSLSSIAISNSVTSIGTNAFEYCDSLSRVEITDIAAWCQISFENPGSNPLSNTGGGFYMNGELVTSIVLPDTVTSIPGYAFYSCDSLSSITIPESVTSIGNSAFYGCDSLEKVEITNIAAWLNIDFEGSYSNPLCYANNGLYLNGEPITEAVLPDSVASIPAYAFYNCKSLSSITIPDSVTSIGEDAFEGCDNLQKVEITDVSAWCQIKFGYWDIHPLYYADYGLYLNGEPITEAVLLDSVTSIPNYAFYNCKSLSSITIPNSVTSIGKYAFLGCTTLSSITIPDSVTYISEGAFSGCSALESMTIPFVGESADTYQYPFGYIFGTGSYTGGIATMQYYYRPSIGSSTYYNTYYIPASLKTVTVTGGNIPYSAFLNCSNLISITLPDSIPYIDDSTFAYCDSLSSITIPEGVTEIGSYAFYCCKNLSSITIPDSVTNIDSAAFYGCSRLSTVHYAGTEAQRAAISIGEENTNLTDATWHYECDGSDSVVPETPPMENPFVDVPEDAYYAEPVLWAVEKGVTTGVSETSFAPDSTCTRAQIVTFLWRANGSPAPSSANNPFTDVPAGQWYTDAVLWAVEKGITSGTSATTFSPDAGCTRGQVATFLWRAEGEPASGAENIFTDIAPGAYYYNAVLWAVEQDITNGVGEGLFAPDATCTRGQIVTFLYRAVA